MASNTSQHSSATETVVLENHSVYESLCNKINLKPVSVARPLEAFRDNDLLSESSADERLARGMSAFLKLVGESSKPVDRLDKSLLDFHIGRLDKQIGHQLDAVMHTPEFQALEGRWRGLKMLVRRTDFRKNARIEVLDVSKHALMRDFEDTPEIIQSGLYRLTYIEEYDTPGGQPISAMISDFEFANSPQDIALLRNVSKVAAAAHMPFIGSVGAAFFGKQSMEEVAAIQDIGNGGRHRGQPRLLPHQALHHPALPGGGNGYWAFAGVADAEGEELKGPGDFVSGVKRVQRSR